MSKRDDLLRSAAAHIDESVGTSDLPAAVATSAVPTQWQGVVKSKSAVEIPLEKIGRDPTQPREEFNPEALARLAESLRTRGLLQPIRVRWDEGLGQYVLIAGERRWRAAGMAGLKTMTAIVVEGELDPGERLAIQLVKNCLREDLKPIEQARAYKRLMDLHGWSGNQLAKELAIAQGTISRALSLLDLPVAVQEQVEQGVLSPSAAHEVAKLDSPETQVEVAERVARERLTRDQVAEAVRAKKSGRFRQLGTPRSKSDSRTAPSSSSPGRPPPQGPRRSPGRCSRAPSRSWPGPVRPTASKRARGPGVSLTQPSNPAMSLSVRRDRPGRARSVPRLAGQLGGKT
jgi:ParB family transcriptional regulator, chromosome partitioning protein